MDEFIINALICGIGVALICGLLGCFAVWKKMAYFGDSLGHGAIFGIGAGILMGINQDVALIITIVSFAAIFSYLKNKDFLSNDLILGILAHGFLSIGIIMISLSDNSNINLHALLFGDILAASKNQIYLIWAMLVPIYGLILYNWKALIINIVSRDIAKSQNINNFALDFLLTCLMALGVAISIPIIGALLVSSMLIIPPASAKKITKNPSAMVFFASIIAIFSVICGITLSYHFDIPCGPAIIAASFVIFVLSNFSKAR